MVIIHCLGNDNKENKFVHVQYICFFFQIFSIQSQVSTQMWNPQVQRTYYIYCLQQQKNSCPVPLPFAWAEPSWVVGILFTCYYQLSKLNRVERRNW